MLPRPLRRAGVDILGAVGVGADGVGPRDVPQRAVAARESIGVDQELYVQAVTLACTRAHTYTQPLTHARNIQLQPKE